MNNNISGTRTTLVHIVLCMRDFSSKEEFLSQVIRIFSTSVQELKTQFPKCFTCNHFEKTMVLQIMNTEKNTINNSLLELQGSMDNFIIDFPCDIIIKLYPKCLEWDYIIISYALICCTKPTVYVYEHKYIKNIDKIVGV